MADGTTLVGLNDSEVESDVAGLLENRGCQLCLEKPAQYTCPRCNVRYCSLECYKCEKHQTCSELFYKNCVMEALRDDTVDEEGRQRMLEVLKRHQQEESEDFLLEEGKEDLADRLEGLNLDKDTDKIWENLTEAEKREFAKAVDSGYIGSIMEVWIPWWINDEQRSSNEMSKDKKTIASTTPKVLKNIPKLQSLIKSKDPSSHIKYSLISILYSYVYICKFYNGSYYEFLQEAIEGLWKLSSVLYHTINFSSLDSVLRNCIESSLQHKEYFNSEAFSLSVINDVSLLLKGSKNGSKSCFVEAALSDIYRLLGKGVNLYKSDERKSMISENEKPKDIGKSLWLAKKKVHFTLAWFHDNQDECFSLEPFLPVVKEALKMEFKQIQDVKKLVEKSRNSASLGNKKLIEEI